MEGPMEQATRIEEQRPHDFVDLSEHAPEVLIDLRYKSSHNFTGRPVEGYGPQRKCWLSLAAADKLRVVAAAARQRGLVIVVYDAYRSVESVRDFQVWAAEPVDNEVPEETSSVKRRYYPNHSKKELFAAGFIASSSSHSRGSTVDLTLLDINKRETYGYGERGQERTITLKDGSEVLLLDDGTVNMGGHFDLFHDCSHHDSPLITDQEAQDNRNYLRSLMNQHGFQALPEEWWHYTLRQEPYPHRAFDFRD